MKGRCGILPAAQKSRPEELVKRSLAVAAFVLTFIAVRLGVAGPVIDGDTLVGPGGERIRLYGIDTPEITQSCERNGKTYRCGEEAKEVLRMMLKRGELVCEPTGKDRYGRIVAICWVDGVDVGSELVRQGHALAYRKYSKRYVPEEEEAKAARAGVWAGRFTAPWEWRKRPATKEGTQSPR